MACLIETIEIIEEKQDKPSSDAPSHDGGAGMDAPIKASPLNEAFPVTAIARPHMKPSAPYADGVAGRDLRRMSGPSTDREDGEMATALRRRLQAAAKSNAAGGT